MACAWTGVGTTNSFLARLSTNAEQRLSSEKCFIDYVQIFLAGCLAFGGAGDRRLRRAEAQAGGVCHADIFGNCSRVRKYAHQQLRCIRHRPLQRSSEQSPMAEMQPATGKRER